MVSSTFSGLSSFVTRAIFVAFLPIAMFADETDESRSAQMFGILRGADSYSIVANLALEKLQSPIPLSTVNVARSLYSHPESALWRLRKEILAGDLQEIELLYPSSEQSRVEREYRPERLNSFRQAWGEIYLDYRMWFGKTVLLGSRIVIQGQSSPMVFIARYIDGNWFLTSDWPVNHVSGLILALAIKNNTVLHASDLKDPIIVDALISRKPEIQFKSKNLPKTAISKTLDSDLQIIFNNYHPVNCRLTDFAQDNKPLVFLRDLASRYPSTDVKDGWRIDDNDPSDPMRFLNWSADKSPGSMTDILGWMPSVHGTMVLLNDLSSVDNAVSPIQVEDSAGNLFAQKFFDMEPNLTELLFHKVAIRELLFKTFAVYAP